MKVDSVNLIKYHSNRVYNLSHTNNNNDMSSDKPSDIRPYPNIYFTGKITSIEDGKSWLLRQCNEILKEDNHEDDQIDEMELKYKAFKVMMSMRNRLEELETESQLLFEDKIMNAQQKYSRARQIQREYNSIRNTKELYIVKTNYYPPDEKMDYSLMNNFKSAIEADNFDLSKVFKNYYEPLNGVNSLKALQKKYPKIKIPSRPEDVIARKLENSITRDFYKELDNVFKSQDKKKAKELISSKVIQILDNNIKIKSPQEKEIAYKKLIKPTVNNITVRYYKLRNTDSFSSVPEFRKANKNLISENDLKLLLVDYDDFVLSVIREQYLNIKNPNEIIYSKDGKNIKVSSLKEFDYKFDKIPSRVIKIIKNSEGVRKSQRDYRNYSLADFKKKLEFYSEKFGSSECILNTIIQFDSCLFGKDDIIMLTKFLQQADKVWDGENTIEELENYIYKNSIRPAHTERINQQEYKRKLEEIKAENKKLATLHNIQEKFDSYINILYDNNLNFLANVCSKYKPTSLDKTQIETANIITEILDKNICDNVLQNKNTIETKLMRVNNYFDYSQSAKDKELFDRACAYAKKSDSEIDIEKAGKYLLNAQFVQSYPTSLEYATNKDVAQRIMQNADKYKAIEYLCKYDDYLDLSKNEKSKISNILDLFNIKDSVEKFIIKNIIENEYLNTDTSKVAKMTDAGNKKVKATISKNAKQQIYEYYKFPRCTEYFEAFEDALGLFASAKQSSGIKKVVSTDANELKIKGSPDRLFAYDSTYYFDEFSPTGLH